MHGYIAPHAFQRRYGSLNPGHVRNDHKRTQVSHIVARGFVKRLSNNRHAYRSFPVITFGKNQLRVVVPHIDGMKLTRLRND